MIGPPIRGGWFPARNGFGSSWACTSVEIGGHMGSTFVAHKRGQHMTPQRATHNSYRNQQQSAVRSGEPGLYLELV
jgi:hypothetical protein